MTLVNSVNHNGWIVQTLSPSGWVNVVEVIDSNDSMSYYVFKERGNAESWLKYLKTITLCPKTEYRVYESLKGYQ